MSNIPCCLDCGTKLSQEPWAPELCPRCSLQLALEQSPIPMDVEEDPEALPTREFPSHTLSPGQILGSRFQIRSLLGRGGMGEVWRAYDLKLRVDVALKTLRAELIQKERALQALHQEVRSAREVISPNVCRVFDLVELDGQELVSMEYIDGTTLVTVLQSRGPLELQESREIASQFLAGLEAIHQAGLIHRDLKPENVMITRSGRVVVMDFGIAKGLADRKTGTVSGTPAYMAPEQARGEAVNARADVFSAGVVLAEMIAPKGEARESIWKGIHHEPPQLPDSPWSPVLKKAVARLAGERYPSAAALARALEEVTLQVEGAEDVRPYPGLASFKEEDAEYFFGRELEVEAMWKKLRRPHLLGLIGPSGAGKSSFLRAGLLPVMPEGWRAVICNPGTAPFQNLARALMPEFSGDMKAMQELLSIEKLDVALSIMKRWRQHHSEVLVTVDQFEELFTLNPPEVQSRFAELLGGMAVESDVRVLLSMRDDFFLRCHEYRSLAPMFSEPTPLHAPTGTALRRALVQPALKCGYRFEEESLVEEMIAEVSEERGALPLLAFAAAQLWERRDRKQGFLMREAYEVIGGVAGALAQHAEATLEKIGHHRLPIVREIFRNLVTAQGTRATRDTEDLHSLFEDKEAAKEVLGELIDARLLTTYDVPAAEDGESSRTRVEIIHESLLNAWPRLVRWQMQDEEGAKLRDELRQAAQMWEEHSRSEDRLWTGTAVQEFQLWRARYSGGLTALEESFGQAMAAKAGRRKRRKRLAVVASLVLAFGVAAVTGTLWRRAVAERRRAEASELRTLGRMELNKDPSEALAYALAGLERDDSPEGRRFALEAVGRGPTARVVNVDPSRMTRAYHLDFSPDGAWLAIGGFYGLRLFPRSGAAPTILAEGLPDPADARLPWFAGDSDHLAWRSAHDWNTVRIWSISKGREVQRFELEGQTEIRVKGRHLIMVTDLTGQWTKTMVREYAFDSGELTVLGSWDRQGASDFDIDPSGRRLAFTKGRGVYIRPLPGRGSGPEHLVGEHSANSSNLRITFGPKGQRLASVDRTGLEFSEVRIWSLTQEDEPLLRLLRAEGRASRPRFNATGSWLAVGYRSEDSSDSILRLWDLEGPRDANPIALRSRNYLFPSAAFDPTGKWAAVTLADEVAFFPIGYGRPHVLHREGGGGAQAGGLGFTPDGTSLLCSFWQSRPSIAVWSLPEGGRRDLSNVRGQTNALAVDPLGEQVVVTTMNGVFIVSLADGMARALPDNPPGGNWHAVAVSRDGRLAAASRSSELEDKGIRIWDLESSDVRVLEESRGEDVCSLGFAPDGTLLSGDERGHVYRWDLQRGGRETVATTGGSNTRLEVSGDGRYLVVTSLMSASGIVTSGSVYALTLYDLKDGSSRAITSHGNGVSAVAFDATGRLLVTGDRDGVVRVGPITGETPHILFGHGSDISSVAVHPDGRWIASAGGAEPTVRLWPMPEGPPLQTLPYEEFMDRLRSLTNLRVVPDEISATGYRVELAPFSGWENVPQW